MPGREYKAGTYSGFTSSEEHWRASFKNMVEAEVNERLPKMCGEVTTELNKSCYSKTKILEGRIAELTSIIQEKDGLISDIKQQRDKITRRADILGLHIALSDNAVSILDAILAAKASRNAEALAAARARFASLLSRINRANKIYAEWAELFDSVASQLGEKLRGGKDISVDEIATFLKSFSADGDVKRKSIDYELQEIEKVKNDKS